MEPTRSLETSGTAVLRRVGSLPAVSEPYSQATLGDALKEHGMEQAEVAADEWKRTWEQAIRLLAGIGDPFTSDDVRAIAGDPWNHPNACGSLFHKAARAGLIRAIGYRKSERARLHSHPLTLWQGVA